MEIDDDGVRSIADALHYNTSIHFIDLHGNYIWTKLNTEISKTILEKTLIQCLRVFVLSLSKRVGLFDYAVVVYLAKFVQNSHLLA